MQNNLFKDVYNSIVCNNEKPEIKQLFMNMVINKLGYSSHSWNILLKTRQTSINEHEVHNVLLNRKKPAVEKKCNFIYK